ncbi:anaphase-promoting complex subunit 5-domain-containing protein [Echria macrotheca]|uniref:Anaphase-promoting complex subunit 5 n=1 Tax=Echria macrotheca TaxID=438768 RepID=A0AAJ0BHI5_9PEZI|nr:anaphase-promoting complex subunit 5-domain-containing protein [Echria macrotheca]
MSRNLTPAKIGLLVLIQLYTQGAVPNDGVVPVLDFLSSHVLGRDLTTPTSSPDDCWARVEGTIRLILSVRDFEQVLSPFAVADRLPGRRLWDRFLETLWSIDSLHALQEFIDRLPRLLAKSRDQLRKLAERGEEPPKGVLLSRNSPFGFFVRKCYLEFTRLQFDHAADLWKAFIKYRQPTAGYWRRRNPQHSRLSFDSVLMTGEHEWGDNTDEIAVVTYGNMLLGGDDGDASLVSSDDIESLLEMQVEAITRFGQRVPSQLKEKFDHLLKEGHSVPSLVHYLEFQDAYRAGDYTSTFNELHRYFDYTMQNRERPLSYQHALMNVAVVQSDLGCHKEALAMMLETIQTARENRDTVCLNFALNWLFHFGKSHPGLVRELESNSMLGSGKEMLSYLRVKAREMGLSVLCSSALIAEAKLGMANGESISAALENMVRSSQLIVEHNMTPMIGSQRLVTTSLWDRLGLASMSTMTCEVFLRCHATHSAFEDELKATSRLAGLLAGRGRYEEAFQKMEALGQNPLRSARASQYWHVYRGLLKLRRDLHRDNLEASDHLLLQLLQAGPECQDPDLVLIIDSIHIEALTRRGDFDAAFAKIERLIASLREDDRDINLRIRLLLSKVHLFDRIGRPEKGFTIAIRAASMAWRARLLSPLWQAIGAVAHILNALREFAAASRLLVAVIPRCLEADNSFTVGTLYSVLADAWVGQAGQRQGQQQALKRTEFLTRANEALDFAFQYFSAVEDAGKMGEALAKKATIMRAMGDYGRSEDYAAKYLALRREVVIRNG